MDDQSKIEATTGHGQTDIVADMEHGAEERARFTAMENGTQEDWSIISRDYIQFAGGEIGRAHV